MRWATGRRLYVRVDAVPAGGGFAVAIDGRPARTPEGRDLGLPSEALARAVADEWRAQAETVEPESMPLTRLASTAIDRVGAGRRDVIDQALKYAETDLLCYRAEALPELAESQQMRWQPLLDWAAEAEGARLRVTAGVSPVAQPKAALAALRAAVEALDDMELAVLSTVTAATGSLIVALALLGGRIGADEAFETSQVDESFQISRWGEDAEAEDRRRRLKADIRAAADFLGLLRG
ncbi:MAG: ATPase [Proteobacteria bacterium]|nr:ATPase [Pseudomonadota bacterium]